MQSQRSMTANLAFSLFGFASPLLFGVVCVPLLIAAIGNGRFGFLSMVWVLIGYFSIFDLGIGRSLTQLVSEQLGSGKTDQLRLTTRSGIKWMTLIAVAGGIFIILCRHWLVAVFGDLPAGLAAEATNAVIMIGIAIPAVVLSSGYRGILEAFGEFRDISMIRAVSGIWTFAAPLTVASVDRSLGTLTLSLVIGRYVTLVAYAVLAERRLLHYPAPVRLEAVGSVRQLLTQGGWMTTSNIVGPVMVYLDRFIIAHVVGVATVTFYTAPYEVVSRFTVLPEAIYSVIFPRMSQMANDPAQIDRLYGMSQKLLGGVMFLISLGTIAIGPLFLELWLGMEFRIRSNTIMSILMIGFFLNTAARPGFNLLQAHARAKWTALVHLMELLPYLLALVFGLQRYGLVGAAVAWLLRAAIDLGVLSYLAHRTASLRTPWLREMAALAIASAALVLVAVIDTLIPRLSVGAIIAVLFAWSFWSRLLPAGEKAMITDRLVFLKRPRR